MQLTRYTDFSLRVLIYLGTHTDHLSSIGEIARTYDISQNHLMKVVHDLGKRGYIETLRGRNGGLKLGMAPSQINIGNVVRHTEDSFRLAKCADCLIATSCNLIGIFDRALHAFMNILDEYTLEDILSERASLYGLFKIDHENHLKERDSTGHADPAKTTDLM